MELLLPSKGQLGFLKASTWSVWLPDVGTLIEFEELSILGWLTQLTSSFNLIVEAEQKNGGPSSSLDHAITLTCEIIWTITYQAQYETVCSHYSRFTSLGWMFYSYYLVSFIDKLVDMNMLPWIRLGPHRISGTRFHVLLSLLHLRFVLLLLHTSSRTSLQVTYYPK